MSHRTLTYLFEAVDDCDDESLKSLVVDWGLLSLFDILSVRCFNSDSVFNRLSFLACSLTDFIFVEWSTTTLWSSRFVVAAAVFFSSSSSWLLLIAFAVVVVLGDSTNVELFIDDAVVFTNVLSNSINELLRRDVDLNYFRKKNYLLLIVYII